MYYTYVLKDIDSNKFYVGSTNNLVRRLKEHRETKSKYSLYCYFAFRDNVIARSFETYLKGGSGRSFSKKHFEFKVDEAIA
jgi:predicted GIY-YIG superfamily endonuclease